jgi:urea transporter
VIAVIVLGGLAAVGVAATVREVLKDGHRRIPTRDGH